VIELAKLRGWRTAHFRPARTAHGWRTAVLGLPVRCRLVRIGGSGEMDDDNLPVTAKWCRDAVAFFLGVEDGTRGPVRWEYGQEGGKRWGVRIELWAEG
jgi:hypothetical protein